MAFKRWTSYRQQHSSPVERLQTGLIPSATTTELIDRGRFAGTATKLPACIF